MQSVASSGSSTSSRCKCHCSITTRRNKSSNSKRCVSHETSGRSIKDIKNHTYFKILCLSISTYKSSSRTCTVSSCQNSSSCTISLPVHIFSKSLAKTSHLLFHGRRKRLKIFVCQFHCLTS